MSSSQQETKLVQRDRSQPSKWTFTILPIRNLLRQEMELDQIWLDPMAGMNSPAAVTNDINPDMPTQYHEDALDFLKRQPSNYYDGVLYDPPYSSGLYKQLYPVSGLKPEDYTKIYSRTYQYNVKNELARILKIGGKCISFAWNSTGLGMVRGFKQSRMLAVAHGAYHNDTLVTVEIKEQTSLLSNNNSNEMQTLKVPSQNLIDLLNNLKLDFKKLQSRIHEIFVMGREEGFDDITIGNWVRQKMESDYNERSIRRVLPDTAKRPYNTDKRYSAKMSDSVLDSSRTFTFTGDLTRLSDGRDAIIFDSDMSRFANKQLKISICECDN